MSRITLNTGTGADTGTGDTLRDGSTYINSMMTELYDLKNRSIDLNAVTVSEYDDLYAHESQILIQRVASTVFLFVMYKSDKSSAKENRLTAHAILKVYELTTKTLLATFDLFYPGLTAGVTMESDEIITMPRMFITGTTLRCVVGNNSKMFYRDIDISDDDYSSWSAGNISVMQMTMKDSGGSDVTVDITASNVQTHLEYIMGDTHADYTYAAIDFLNSGNVLIYNNVWYAVLELWAGVGNKNVNILASSADSGATWTLGSIIGYTTSNRIDLWEISLSVISTTFHAVARSGNNVYHYSSSDLGESWSVGDIIFSSLTYESKPITVNYYKSSGTLKTLVGVTLISEVSGMTNHRTTFAIYETSDFLTFTEIVKVVSESFCHYPTIAAFSNSLYWGYTKGLKYSMTTGTYPDGYNKNTIVVASIY